MAFESQLHSPFVLDPVPEGLCVGCVFGTHVRHSDTVTHRIHGLKSREGRARSRTVRTVCFVRCLGIVQVQFRKTDDRVGEKYILVSLVRERPRSLVFVIERLGNTVRTSFLFLQERTCRI